MKSLKELYKIGRGPSSSHTMGPEKACRIFKAKNIEAEEFKVTLFGSLSATGKGHLTDKIIEETGLKPYEISVAISMLELKGAIVRNGSEYEITR